MIDLAIERFFDGLHFIRNEISLLVSLPVHENIKLLTLEDVDIDATFQKNILCHTENCHLPRHNKHYHNSSAAFLDIKKTILFFQECVVFKNICINL